MPADWRETRYRRLMAERANAAANLHGFRRQGTPGRPVTALIAKAIAEEIARLATLDAELAGLNMIVEIPASTILLDGRAAVRQLERRLVVS